MKNLIDLFIDEEFTCINGILSGQHIAGIILYINYLHRFLWIKRRRKKAKRRRTRFKIFRRNLI